MSESETLTVTCPGCQHVAEVPAWSSVNGTLEPELRAQLLAGRLNLFTCPACDFQAHLPMELLYHDMALEYAAFYYPIEQVAAPNMARSFKPTGQFSLPVPPELTDEVPPHLQHIHVVLGMDELARYVRFREALHAAQLEA